MSSLDSLAAQSLFATHLALAGFGFFLLGRLLLSKVPSRFPLIFTAVYAGQMFAWFGSYLLLPLNAALFLASGLALPLPLIFWLGIAAVALAIAGRTGRIPRSWRVTSFFPPQMLLLLAGAAGGLWLVCGAYSDHLGALGLDTHQHIYWTNQILDAGYLPLVFRHTEALASYPKAFHLLVALWVAAGGGALVGPFLKLMPFLQSFLPCLVFAELLIARASLEDRSEGAQRLLALVLTSLLLATSFAWTAMVYPETDLNSTPRFASNGLLFLPALLAIAGRVYSSPRLETGSLLCVPPVAGLALAMNVVVAGQLVFFLVPLLACLGGFGPALLRALPRRGLIFSLALPLVIALSDPFIVSSWTRAFPTVGEPFLEWMGVASQEQIDAWGVMSGADFVAEEDPAPSYAGWIDIGGLGLRSVVAGLVVWPGAAGETFPFLHDLQSRSGRWIQRGLVLALALAAFAAVATGRVRREDPARRFAYRLWWGVMAGVVSGAIGQVVLWRFVTGLAEGRGYAFELLRDYTAASVLHVSLVAGAMLLLATANWAIASWPVPAARARRLMSGAFMGVASLALVLAPAGLQRLQPEVGAERMFWSRIEAEDLEALERIEAAIEEWEVVMVPAEVWKIGAERWIIPQGETASLLPFARSRILFNSRLGHGATVNWRDLARFCNGSPVERREFLRAHDVGWILVKAKGAEAPEFSRRFGLCGASLISLGAEARPTRREGNLSLYRIQPQG